MQKKKIAIIIGVVVFALFIIGISINGGKNSTTNNDAATIGTYDDSSSSIEKTDSTTPSRCIPVPDNTIASIQSTLEEGLTLRSVKAVKSIDYKNIYFISADLEGSGFGEKDDYVTFATNGINNEGMFYSISYVASEFSVLPSGSTTDAKMTMLDDGAKESENCVNS